MTARERVAVATAEGLKITIVVSVLASVLTVCYGFYVRGRHIDTALEAATRQSGTIIRLLDENDDLVEQVEAERAQAARRYARASADRDRIQANLDDLVALLDRHGIRRP
jgi:hypothetical protein